MSHFIFKAKKPTGETYDSERDATDRYELYKIIRQSGDEIISLDEKKSSHGLHMELNFGIFGKVKTIDKINFARNLGSMMEAGLPLSRALSVLERQAHNKNFKKVITGLVENISSGQTFADGLAKNEKVFPPVFISMVRAGEQSGTLSEALKTVGLQMERSFTLERRIKGALIYPSVIVFAMVVIAILMFVFVVPVLMKTFVELNVALPFPTRVVLGISNIIQHQGLWVLLGVFLGIFGLRWWSRRPSGKKIVHRSMLRIPIIGSLVQEVNAARTARTLSSLFTAGVNVLESVIITETIIQNVHFKEVLTKASEAIRKGKQMSDVFAENLKLYPVFFSEMMNVGEETGKTAEMLLGVAKYYEEDVEQKTKDMSTVIEPILMIFIAAGVGFFAIAMISPMYSLVNAI